MATTADRLMETQTNTVQAAEGSPLAVLLPALCRLDRLLQAAMQSFQQSHHIDISAPFRGLYLGSEDVTRALAQPPGIPAFAFDRTGSGFAGAGSSLLSDLQAAFGLTQFDVDVVVIALAPEI